MQRRAVLGIGNTILGDEGVGVHVVRRMRRACTLASAPEWIEGGTAGIDLALFMEGYDALVIVDAVALPGIGPGDLVVRRNGELVPEPVPERVTAHGLGVVGMLALAHALDILPAQIALVGVAPYEITWGCGLSPPMQARLPVIEKAVLDELARMEMPHETAATSHRSAVWARG